MLPNTILEVNVTWSYERPIVAAQTEQSVCSSGASTPSAIIIVLVGDRRELVFLQHEFKLTNAPTLAASDSRCHLPGWLTFRVWV
jgi:hypothetical protein